MKMRMRLGLEVRGVGLRMRRTICGGKNENQDKNVRIGRKKSVR